MRAEAELRLLTRAGPDSLLDFIDLLLDIPAMAVRAANGGLLFPVNVGRQTLVFFAVAVVKVSPPTRLRAQDWPTSHGSRGPYCRGTLTT